MCLLNLEEKFGNSVLFYLNYNKIIKQNNKVLKFYLIIYNKISVLYLFRGIYELRENEENNSQSNILNELTNDKKIICYYL